MYIINWEIFYGLKMFLKPITINNTFIDLTNLMLELPDLQITARISIGIFEKIQRTANQSCKIREQFFTVCSLTSSIRFFPGGQVFTVVRKHTLVVV